MPSAVCDFGYVVLPDGFMLEPNSDDTEKPITTEQPDSLKISNGDTKTKAEGDGTEKPVKTKQPDSLEVGDVRTPKLKMILKNLLLKSNKRAQK